MNKATHSNRAPAAIGPYSQAIQTDNGTVYCSGQLGLDPNTGTFAAADAAGQTRQALQNLGAILREAGLSFRNVTKCTVFLANMADFAAVNEVYAEFFSEPYPARSAIQVAALPKGGLVEVEAIAVV